MSDQDAAPTTEPPTAVTVVAAHRVKAGRERDFERWEIGITAAASAFPGYLGSDLLRPVEGVQEDWVVVFRFESASTLHAWLDSPERAKWIADGDDLFERVDLHKVGTGLGGWFPGAVVSTAPPAAPADYKQAMAVLLALYPVVMLLSLYFFPRLESLPYAANVFINNVVSIAILQWLLMPLITRWLGPWLDDSGGRTTVLGILGLLAAYTAMVAAFIAIP